MPIVDRVVLVVAITAIAALGWYFFAPRRAHVAEANGRVQRVQIKVRGGYSPSGSLQRGQGHSGSPAA